MASHHDHLFQVAFGDPEHAVPDRARADLEDTFLTLQLTPGTSLDHVWALAGVRVE